MALPLEECFNLHLLGQQETDFTPVMGSAYTSSQKMEVAGLCEMSFDFLKAMWRYFPEDRTLRNHCRESLYSYRE
jgi:hypothetical protein